MNPCYPLWIFFVGYKYCCFRLGFCCVVKREKLYYCFLYFFFPPENSKSLQLLGRSQIFKPCKYCLVWIFFFCAYFSLFLHLIDLGIRVYSPNPYSFNTLVSIAELKFNLLISSLNTSLLTETDSSLTSHAQILIVSLFRNCSLLYFWWK